MTRTERTAPVDLTETERNTILHALMVAAKRYKEHVTALQDITHGEDVGTDAQAVHRLQDQFERQIAEAGEMAERIAAAEYVRLGPEAGRLSV